MRIKQFNLVALLDFPNVIRPNESDQKYPRGYRCLFPYVSEWEKVFLGHIASRDRCGNCNSTVRSILLQCLVLLLGASWEQDGYES